MIGYKLLTAPERALAEYMSEVSEEAYCAAWYCGLEYYLWEGVLGRRRAFGRTTISQKKRQKFKELSEKCEGWIIFDMKLGEIWVSFESWQRMYDKWQEDHSSK
jgi:hypothetical protein